MKNRERIAKTDICDYLTDMNSFLMDCSLGVDCINVTLKKESYRDVSKKAFMIVTHVSALS